MRIRPTYQIEHPTGSVEWFGVRVVDDFDALLLLGPLEQEYAAVLVHSQPDTAVVASIFGGSVRTAARGQYLHVIRAIEHLSNTPPQILMYEALGAPIFIRP